MLSCEPWLILGGRGLKNCPFCDNFMNSKGAGRSHAISRGAGTAFACPVPTYLSPAYYCFHIRSSSSHPSVKAGQMGVPWWRQQQEVWEQHPLLHSYTVYFVATTPFCYLCIAQSPPQPTTSPFLFLSLNYPTQHYSVALKKKPKQKLIKGWKGEQNGRPFWRQNSIPLPQQ